MPCYEVRLYTVEFKAKNKDILKVVLEGIGIRVQERDNIFYLSGLLNGEIDLTKQEAQINDSKMINWVKQKYSEEIVKKVAQKKKWLFKKMADNKFQLKRF